MSHELRPPLSAVIGYSEMLQAEMEDLGHDNLLPDMSKIEANVRHLLGLINDVLDLSKIEAERLETYVEDFSVDSVVRDVASTVEALVAEKRNVLTLDLATDLGAAHTDVTKLRQCLINLLGNAAKFTEAGRITRSAKRDEREGPTGSLSAWSIPASARTPSTRNGCSSVSPRRTPRSRASMAARGWACPSPAPSPPCSAARSRWRVPPAI
jgi:signal transduction histidine kinase